MVTCPATHYDYVGRCPTKCVQPKGHEGDWHDDGAMRWRQCLDPRWPFRVAHYVEEATYIFSVAADRIYRADLGERLRVFARKVLDKQEVSGSDA